MFCGVEGCVLGWEGCVLGGGRGVIEWWEGCFGGGMGVFLAVGEVCFGRWEGYVLGGGRGRVVFVYLFIHASVAEDYPVISTVSKVHGYFLPTTTLFHTPPEYLGGIPGV